MDRNIASYIILRNEGAKIHREHWTCQKPLDSKSLGLARKKEKHTSRRTRARSSRTWLLRFLERLKKKRVFAPALESKGIGPDFVAAASSGFPLSRSRSRAAAYRDRRSIVHGFRFYISESLRGRSSCLLRGTSRSRCSVVTFVPEMERGSEHRSPWTKFTPVC